MPASRLQHRVWTLLRPAEPGDVASRWVDRGLIALIAASAAAVVLATVAPVRARYGGLLAAFEVFSVAVFTTEYALRLWAAPSDPRYAGAVRGRLRWARTPLALVDLLAVLPFFLPALGFDGRVFRLLRLVRLAKFGRYVPVFGLFTDVFRRRRAELLVTLEALALLLLLAASMMYFAEGAVQPDAFPSIPAAMWWAINVLTTVGYGDVVPVTTAGRVIGAFVAVIGICFLALPTAILGAGFVEAVEQRRRGSAARADAAAAHAEQAARHAEAATDERARCPHCGAVLPARRAAAPAPRPHE
ncbi:MAG: potassium channel family protein, partial [Rubricoccaceae bacterium]